MRRRVKGGTMSRRARSRSEIDSLRGAIREGMSSSEEREESAKEEGISGARWEHGGIGQGLKSIELLED